MSFQQHHSNDREGAPLLGAPGVHFHPTDEELMGFYLKEKVANSNTDFDAIGEVDFNKCEPWDLPAMAKEGDQGIFYFFSLNIKDRKYATGMRTNRATQAGYWKPTGRDRKVITRRTGRLLGLKKTLVFYTGRGSKSGKTSWRMHEYRLQDESKSDQEQWVVCKAFEKRVSNKMAAETSNCNGGSNAKCSTFQPCSYLPSLPSLKSPGSNFVKPNTLSEPPDYFQGGTSQANPETTLKQANSTLEYLREPLLGAPGVHFHPTDEELIGELMSHYLTQKVANSNSVFQALGEVDFNKCVPWDLPAMAKVGDQGIFYFFSLNIKDRKYATGMRTNRATQAGYWKPTGRDRKVITRRTGRLLGLKKTLVFYTGRGSKSGKTSWRMHEYRLQDESKSDQKQWVVCKVFEKRVSNKMAAETSNCNGGSNAKDSTFQPCSYLPALASLESPGLNFVKPNTISEPPDYLQGGTSSKPRDDFEAVQ